MRTYLSQTNFSNYDFIVPIPLDSKRERERGFNQALTIAHMIKRIATRQSLTIKTVLKKKTNTPRQSQLGRSERLTNLSGAFRLNLFQEVRGKHVLLVDDIFTTGSTVNECAKLLKEKGADRVDFFAIARAQTG
jgi:ComF family protein